MKVVFLRAVKNVAQKGEIKDVSDGYYLNFLAPQKCAVPATASQVAHIQTQLKSATLKLESMKESAASIKERIEGQTIGLSEKVSELGKLYAAVSAKEIASAIKAELKVEIPEKNIQMSEPIKAIGEFPVDINLFKGVTARLKLNVTAK